MAPRRKNKTQQSTQVSEPLIVESEFIKKLMSEERDMFRYAVDKIVESKLGEASGFGTSEQFKSLVDAVKKVSEGALSSQGRLESKTVQKNIAFMEEEISKLSSSKEISVDQAEYLESILAELKVSNKHMLKTQHSLSAVVKKRIKEKIPSITGIMSSIGLNNPGLVFAGQLIQDIVDERRRRKDEQKRLLEPYKQAKIDKQLEELQKPKTQEATEIKGSNSSDQTDQKEDKLVQRSQEKAFSDLLESMTILSSSIGESSEIFKESVNVYKKALDNLLVISGADQELRDSVDAAISELRDADNPDPEVFVKLNKDILTMTAVNRLHLPSIDDNIETLVKDTESAKFQEIEKERERKLEHEQLIDALESLGAKGLTQPVKITAGGEGIVSHFMDGITALSTLGTFLKGAKFMGIIKGIGKLAGWAGLAYSAIEFGIGAFKGWKNAAEKLGKAAEDLTVSDKIASAIGGGIGALGNLADSILGFFGFETEIGKWADENYTKFYASLLNRIETAIKSIYNFFANSFDIAFPEGFSLTEMVKAPVRLATAWFDTLFKIAFPETDWTMTGFIQEVFDNTIELLKKIFDFDFEKIYDDLVTKMKNKLNFTGFNFFSNDEGKTQGVVPPKEKTGLSARMKAEKAAKRLEAKEKEAITPKTEEGMKILTPFTSPSPIEPNDLPVPNEEYMLKHMPKRKGVFKDAPIPPDGVYPLPLSFNENSSLPNYIVQDVSKRESVTQALANDSIQREKDKQRQSAAIINAPKTTNNVTNNSQSTSVSAGVNPRETDSTLRILQYGAAW